MTRTWMVGGAAAAVAAGGLALWSSGLLAQGGSLQPPPVDLALRESFEVPPADAQTEAVVAAAQAFLATLSDDQRATAVFAFDDNAQRSNWSNFPDGPMQRAGVRRDGLAPGQLAALDALLATVLSEEGVRNVELQLAAEDVLGDVPDDGPGGANFGSEFYYAAFLGEPSATEPWMLQFGGHHLAINATFHEPDASFAPMLTGGEPLRLAYEGQEVYITEEETTAAQALMHSLSDAQKAEAVRGATASTSSSAPARTAR